MHLRISLLTLFVLFNAVTAVVKFCKRCANFVHKLAKMMQTEVLRDELHHVGELQEHFRQLPFFLVIQRQFGCIDYFLDIVGEISSAVASNRTYASIRVEKVNCCVTFVFQHLKRRTFVLYVCLLKGCWISSDWSFDLDACQWGRETNTCIANPVRHIHFKLHLYRSKGENIESQNVKQLILNSHLELFYRFLFFCILFGKFCY